MNTITVIMADEPLAAQGYALDEGFAPVLWPEVADGMPVSNAVLFARVDKWIALLAEKPIAVVTHKFEEYGCGSGYNPLAYITCPECGEPLESPYIECACGWGSARDAP